MHKIRNLISVIFVEAPTGIHFSTKSMQLWQLCGGKMKINLHFSRGKKSSGYFQAYSPEEFNSRMKLLKSACEMSRICKSGFLNVTLVDECAHRRTHGGAHIRLVTPIHGLTRRLFCSQLSACAGSPPPVCSSACLSVLPTGNLCLTSPS